MWGVRTLGLLLLALPAASQQRTAVELRFVSAASGARTFVFAFDRNGVHEAGSTKDPNTFSIDDLWACPDSADADFTPSGPRLFVLASDNAGTFLDPAAICKQRGHRRRIVIELEPATTVKLYVWLKSQDLRPMILDEMANVNWLFRRNLAGATFVPEFVDDFTADRDTSRDDIGQAVRKVRRHGKSPQIPDNGCDDLRSNAADFVKPDGVNVYVGLGANFTCSSTPANPRKNIVFVQDLPVLGATAHELAHAFGVDGSNDGDPKVSYSNGHVPPTKIAGAVPDDSDASKFFEPNNTMWPESMVLHDRLTLGQVFWMNFSSFSFLSQFRESAGDKTHHLVCPRDCPRYAVDYPITKSGADPRVPLAAIPSAQPVGHEANAQTDPDPLVLACSVERNSDCSSNVFAHLKSTADRLQTKLNAAARLSNANTAFAVQFELSANIAGHPHYCTKEELEDSLSKRFAEICDPGEQNPNGPPCGHNSVEKFVDFWRRNVVAAGLIQATTALAVGAAVMKGTAAPGDQGYASMAYGKAREVIDVKRADHLRNIMGKRVLWMDSPGNNRVEQALLKGLGVEIDCSPDPANAIQQLRDGHKMKIRGFPGGAKYSAVIANFGDGRAAQLINAMKRRKILVPAIIYSRDVTDSMKQSASKLGAFGETGDPVDLAELVFRALESPQ